MLNIFQISVIDNKVDFLSPLDSFVKIGWAAFSGQLGEMLV
jgi:hypothetical protein